MRALLIAHRGNIDGPNPERENSPDYIDEAIADNYSVEIDLWIIDNKLYLGHDKPQYEVSFQWLFSRSYSLFVHAKNIHALNWLIGTNLNAFYHTCDKHTIISNCNLIWSHDLSEAGSSSIIPMLDDVSNPPDNVYGICSDFVSKLRV